MGVIRYKIWYDLWENKGRTLRVIAIIAIGAFAVGTVLGAKEFILQDVSSTWQASAPATIGLEVKPAVDDTMLETLEKLKEIEAITGWSQDKTVRWRRSPTEPWQSATLVALDDYDDQAIRQVKLDHGDWPRRKLMGVQRDRQLGEGDQVFLYVSDKVYPVELNGVLYNAAYPSAFSSPDPLFFTTRERFAELTGESGSSLVLATIPDYSEARVQAAADVVQHELEKQDIEIEPAIAAPGGFTSRTGKPDQFTGQDAINSVFVILTIMAASTLILGLFLVYNTINAIITQQVNQIGVMKAVGAGFGQILGVYFSLVLVYAALALLVAVPLGALGAYGLRTLMVMRIGMELGPFAISSRAVMVQTAVALLSPLLVATVPIYAGASVTVREAISTYGLGGVSGLLDRLLVKLDFIPRIVSLTLSNTFRNKKRLLLTQITLVGAGIIFMMVMNTRTTLQNTFGNVLLSIYKVNILLDLKDEARIKTLESLALGHPEVKTVEVWGTASGTARRQGQPQSNDDNPINLRGIPTPSVTYLPQMRAGRWLQAGDEYAVVLSQALAEQMGIGVGNWITIDIPTTRQSDWQVVGLLFEPVDQNVALAPRDTLLKETRQVGRGKLIRGQTIHGDPDSEAATAKALRTIYERQGYEVLPSTKDTSYRLATSQTDRMALLFIILTGMAVMTAVVGAVALSGTLSINVMERTREIGVMRAIGASAAMVAGQFVGEGLILGWLSWLLAIPLSLPAGLLIVRTLSAVLKIELVYQISWVGIWYWLSIITVLAVIASWFPARRAAQTSVRESLAYI
ncbi:MAG: ABC transporter permease [Anaerolineaceae bacterium]|nr:ABC transporter permease [Anaerolineaceae bacterium]MCB9099783.1 ABC transporter permease [Anaerolineales bacterium]